MTIPTNSKHRDVLITAHASQGQNHKTRYLLSHEHMDILGGPQILVGILAPPPLSTQTKIGSNRVGWSRSQKTSLATTHIWEKETNNPRKQGYCPTPTILGLWGQTPKQRFNPGLGPSWFRTQHNFGVTHPTQHPAAAVNRGPQGPQLWIATSARLFSADRRCVVQMAMGPRIGPETPRVAPVDGHMDENLCFAFHCFFFSFFWWLHFGPDPCEF